MNYTQYKSKHGKRPQSGNKQKENWIYKIGYNEFFIIIQTINHIIIIKIK